MQIFTPERRRGRRRAKEKKEEDSALERPLEEGQNNTANWLEKGLEKYSNQRRRRRDTSPNSEFNSPRTLEDLILPGTQ